MLNPARSQDSGSSPSGEVSTSPHVLFLPSSLLDFGARVCGLGRCTGRCTFCGLEITAESSLAWARVQDGGLRWPTCSKDINLEEDREGSGWWLGWWGGHSFMAGHTNDPSQGKLAIFSQSCIYLSSPSSSKDTHACTHRFKEDFWPASCHLS